MKIKYFTYYKYCFVYFLNVSTFCNGQDIYMYNLCICQPHVTHRRLLFSYLQTSNLFRNEVGEISWLVLAIVFRVQYRGTNSFLGCKMGRLYDISSQSVFRIQHQIDINSRHGSRNFCQGGGGGGPTFWKILTSKKKTTTKREREGEREDGFSIYSALVWLKSIFPLKQLYRQ